MFLSRERSARTVIGALMLIALTGCGLFSKDEEGQGPAPLPDFKAEVRIDSVWSHGIGNGQGKLYNRLAPAVDGDMIVAAAANGAVEAYNRHTGRSLWDADIDRPLSGGVGIGGGLVLVVSDDGQLWALNAADGKEAWHVQLDGQVLSPPQCNGSVVAVVMFNGQLVGLDAKTGAKRWNYAAANPVLMLRASSAPVIHDDVVIAGFANGKVAGVAADTGKPLWETRIGTPQGSSEIERQVDVDGNLLISENTLYAVAYQGQLVAIDLRSGQRLWERKASSYVDLSEGFNNIYAVTTDGSIIAFAKNDQGVRWEQTALARRQLTGSATWNNYVAVGDFEGYLHLLSQVDGHFVARTRVDSDGLRVAPLVVDDMLYAYGNSGDLVAYRLRGAK
jgi:outer membrane protein assembly factor BamB